MLSSVQLQEKAVKVYTDKGKRLSDTALKCIRTIQYAELYPTSANVKKSDSARERLDLILADVESREPSKMTVHLSGEMVLTDERIKNSAVRYYEMSVEIAKARENLTRRINELTASKQDIEGKIPHAQTDEFKNALREVASLFGTDALPDTVSE